MTYQTPGWHGYPSFRYGPLSIARENPVAVATSSRAHCELYRRHHALDVHLRESRQEQVAGSVDDSAYYANLIYIGILAFSKGEKNVSMPEGA